MKNYTSHADGSSSKSTEQIQNSTGVQYRVSGNLLICRQTTKTVPFGYCGSRGSITGFSCGSGIRMRRYLRECMAEYEHMVTLTYPEGYPSDGAEVKNHLRRFLQEVRRWDDRYCRQVGVPSGSHSSFWFLEFQRRGAPHFHIFLNRCPSKEWVSSKWYGIVGSEDIRHFQAGTRTEKLKSGRTGTISYASKYAAKLEQKSVPEGYENVGRFWGVYGYRATMSATAFVSRSDSGGQMILKCQESMQSLLEHGKKTGTVEEIVRDSGVLVFVFHSRHDQQVMRRLVSYMNIILMPDWLYFFDAEVDYGE